MPREVTHIAILAQQVCHKLPQLPDPGEKRCKATVNNYFPGGQVKFSVLGVRSRHFLIEGSATCNHPTPIQSSQSICRYRAFKRSSVAFESAIDENANVPQVSRHVSRQTPGKCPLRGRASGGVSPVFPKTDQTCSRKRYPFSLIGTRALHVIGNYEKAC